MKYSELNLADLVFRLPRSRSEPEFEDDQRASLTYGQFRVMIYVLLKGDSGLAALPEPEAWGTSEFDRYRAIYSIGEKDIAAAKSAKELAHVVSGLAIKGILLSDGSSKRLVEFRSPKVRGFIQGSADAGSREVVFECFANDRPTARKVTVAFSRLDSSVRDTEIERFVAAIEITDGTEIGTSKCAD